MRAKAIIFEKGGKIFSARFSNEQHPVCKSDDNEYLKKRMHESRRDEIHIYNPILTSKKLFVFFTSSGSRRAIPPSSLVSK
jgi:hypothetical protein